MIRSGTAFLAMALALGWTGSGHDDSIGAQMVPITLKDSGGRSLLVSRYEVTVASWRKCYRDGGCPHMPESLAGADDVPVTGVNYIDVGKYLEWANGRSRRELRLPTLNEWRALNPAPVKEPQLRFTDPRMAWAANYGQEKKAPAGPPRPGGSFSTTSSGIADLDGNVWEWTTSHFGVWDASARRLETSSPMKSIRGGAFDTYFDVQATCQFQSGESPIRRKHNIGFRCALAVADVVPLDLDQVGSASVDSTLDESSAVGEHAAGGDFA